jgi:hypothetical protein
MWIGFKHMMNFPSLLTLTPPQRCLKVLVGGDACDCKEHQISIPLSAIAMTRCLLLDLACLVLQVVDYTSADYVELYKGQPFDIVVDAIAGKQGTRR